jgi:hypothetical protein
VPLTEIQFMALIVPGCFFFLRWIRTRSGRNLAAAAVCIAIATASRYEGWVFALMFVAAVAVHHRTSGSGSRLSQTGVAAIVFIFPAIWTLAEYFHVSYSAGFLSAPRNNYAVIYGNSFSGILQHGVLTQYFLQNMLSWNILGVGGLALVWRSDPEIREWFILPGGAFLIMVVLSLAGWALPNHSFWRVAVVWSVLTVPFTASLIIGQTRRFPRLVVPVVMLVLLMFFGEAIIMARVPDFSKDEKESGEYLGREMAVIGDRGRVLIESGSWQYMHLMVASGFHDRFICNTGYDPSYPSKAVVDETQPVVADSVYRRGIRWIAARTAAWKSTLNGDSLLHDKKEFGRWTIYAVGTGSR